MKKKILNWGLLSTARINERLISPIRKSSRSKLLAVASRDLKVLNVLQKNLIYLMHMARMKNY